MVTPRGNIMELIDNIHDKRILADRNRYMTDELHNTILRYLDQVASDPETDLNKMAEMIIQEVRNT